MRYSFGLILLIVFLTGCGTTATPIDQAKSPSADRIYSSVPVNSSKPANLTIIRDSGLHGAEHVIEVFVNGLHVADLNQGEKYSTPVEPGVVFIEARFHNVLGKVPPVQVETLLASDKRYFYRVGLDELTLRLLRDLSLSK